MGDAPITVVVTRRVKPDCTAAFEAAVRDWVPKATALLGHLGVLMLQPPLGGDEYGAVLRFRSADDWRAFQAWPVYLAWLDGLRPLLLTEPTVEECHGLEAWFRTPVGHAPPPRWKMAVVTWVGVNLTAYAMTMTLKPLIDPWPFFFSFITFNAGVVAGLTWVVMPLLTRLFRPWIHGR